MQNLYTALAKFHADLPTIPKSRTVKVTTRGGQSYSFDYAPLDAIMAIVRPCLAQHSLCLLQRVVPEGVETVVAHESGESFTSMVPVMFNGGSPQEYASALTYARRYGVTLALCLTTEEDDDGNSASGNTATVTRNREVTGPKVTPETLERLFPLVEASGKLTQITTFYNVAKLGDLTEAQARTVIERLEAAK